MDRITGEMTFLSKEQIDNTDKQLNIIKRYGTDCTRTDFAILLGAAPSMWWTKDTCDFTDGVWCASNVVVNFNDTRVGARPAIPYSSIKDVAIEKPSIPGLDTDDIIEVTYGEYPQTLVDKDLSRELEDYYRRSPFKVRKYYTTNALAHDGTFLEESIIDFEPREHRVVFYKGKKYIRSFFKFPPLESFTGKISHDVSDPYWIAVEPIEWLVDKKADIALSEKILFAGVRYNDKREEDFNQTEIKQYMDEYFSKEIQPVTRTREIVQPKENPRPIERKTRLQKLNPDTTALQDRKKMTDTEIIHSWIEAGQSVLLRGPSGIGKTERLTELYPNLIYLKLTNNMYPEKVVGSMNLQTGQNIPPDFAKQVLLECATEEEKNLINADIQNLYAFADEIYNRSKSSDEKIVILLDELLNVKPAVQSLVYTLVLNRLIETGKGLKLPKNTVIVATGNPKKYSSAASDLAGPLEKRFDHILDMRPKVEEWLNEYAIPNKVHPSVIGYILSKYIYSGKSEKLSDIGYFYEEPEVGERNLDENGCNGRTNDPRSWVSLSNTLYNLEEELQKGNLIGKNVEEKLKIDVISKLREEWAMEFINFYNIPTLTVEEVVTESYSQADLPIDTNDRFAYMTSLLLADEKQVGKCREFIRKYCDPEYLQLYDICWAGNDDKRMMLISELQEMAAINEESVGKRL